MGSPSLEDSDSTAQGPELSGSCLDCALAKKSWTRGSLRSLPACSSVICGMIWYTSKAKTLQTCRQHLQVQKSIVACTALAQSPLEWAAAAMNPTAMPEGMERKGIYRYSARWGKLAKQSTSTQNVTQNQDANIPYFSWCVSGSPWLVLDVRTQPEWGLGESKSTHPSELSWDIDPALAQIEMPSALWNWQTKILGKKINQPVCFVPKHWNYIFK